jgi:hypothetical protein
MNRSVNLSPNLAHYLAPSNPGHCRSGRPAGIEILMALVLLALMTFASAPHAAAQTTVLMGNTGYGSTVDSNSGGTAQAFGITAGATGTVTSLRFFVNGSATVRTLSLGLYSNASGHPGTLLAQGKISSLRLGDWNTVSVAGVNITQGTVYWLAVLGTSGTLKFRDNQGSGCLSENSAQSSLSSLPSSWSRGSSRSNDCTVSGYASGTKSTTTSGTLSASQTSVSFGTVTTGTTASQNITITDSGSASVTISQIAASGSGFSVTAPALPLTLSAGQSTTITARFAPTATGSVTGNIAVTSNTTNSTLNVSLSGTGASPTTASGLLTLSPTSTSFSNVLVGSSSSLPVIVKNTGTASATISQATVTGAGFSLTGLTLPATLAAGQSISFNVIFAPIVTGTVTGNVAITSNAQNSVVNEGLSGTGVTAHSVTLNWNASTSTSVAGYRVFRGTVPGGPYTLMNSSLLNRLTFTDATVQAGQTYYYVTAAVDGNSTQSGYSNEVKAIVPSP